MIVGEASRGSGKMRLLPRLSRAGEAGEHNSSTAPNAVRSRSDRTGGDARTTDRDHGRVCS
jgi:hypothetical protein